ncbi:hypothetical protein, partial [Peribacillus saganii]|uniref:hypothetical protein n=1 Tax=Peribacillus saganii TaxID=2303992 RepID=UPI001F253CDB
KPITSEGKKRLLSALVLCLSGLTRALPLFHPHFLVRCLFGGAYSMYCGKNGSRETSRCKRRGGFRTAREKASTLSGINRQV